MKHLKPFFLFESGIPTAKLKPLNDAIKNLFNDAKFQPHIDDINQYTGGNRKFFVFVDASESKFGTVYDVYFRQDDSKPSVEESKINSEIKWSYVDILHLILDHTETSSGAAVMSKFEYFGHKLEGQKNGHLLTVEDVTPEAKEYLESIDEEDSGLISNEYVPIYFQFIVKK